MKKRENTLTTDVEDLVRECVITQATHQVSEHLTDALERLDPVSRELLKAHFRGATIDDLVQHTRLSREKISGCIARAKRDLIHQLQSKIPTKQ